MSLSGIALGVGLVSDTAVVILDALYRCFTDSRNGKKPPSSSPVSVQLIAERAASVAASSFGGTATTAVVFVPVLFLPGALGALFGDMAVSIVSSVTTGWLYAQFALPALFRLTFRGKPEGKVCGAPAALTGLSAPFCARGYKKFYAKTLLKTMRVPYRTLGAALFCSALGALLLAVRPAPLISDDAAAEIEAGLVFPAGTLLAEAADEARNAAALIAALPEVETVFGWAGAEDEDVKRRASAGYRPETFKFRALLAARTKPEAAREAVRRALEDVPAHITVYVDFPRSQKEKILGLSGAASVAVTGKTAREARNKAKTLVEAVKNDKTGAALGVRLRPEGGRVRLRIIPRREALAHLGLRSADIAGAALMATEGALTSRLEIDGRPLDVRVRGGDSGGGGFQIRRNAPSPARTLETIPVGISGGTQGGGTPVLLGDTGVIEEEYAEAALLRLDRADTVYADIAVKKGGGSFWKGLKQFTKNEGFDRTEESVFVKYRGTLYVTVALVAILLYVTMGAQFESFKMPLILMTAILFSLAGAGPALFLSGSGLDLGAVIGIITLFGISVNNGMVLYETALSGIEAGLPVKKAVYLGALERLSPVLATTLTTAIALIPIAFSRTGERSMALAMLGGVLASAGICLFTLPPLFARSLLKKTRLSSDNLHEGMDARKDEKQNTGNGVSADCPHHSRRMI
jgi:multidrug efflux pump subunit AcrB